VSDVSDAVTLEEIELSDLALLDYFHGISFVGGLLLDQHDAPESSFAQVFEVLVVFGASYFFVLREVDFFGVSGIIDFADFFILEYLL
jgi:hypothetical protein